jgi:heme-degrading monooxygenase HmoA
MYVIIWEFRPAPGREAEFEEQYGPTGAWVRLFQSASGYRGTDFLRSSSSPATYLTMDRWDSAAEYERFRHDRESEYLVIDEQCRQLTQEERHIGSYVSIDPATLL